MADTDLDDGDMARLLARTADMLKQVCWGSKGGRPRCNVACAPAAALCVLGPLGW